MKRDWIYEVIVTTSGSDGKANASPAGVWKNDKGDILFRVETRSRTYRNLADTRSFGINFVEDALLFYYALFEKEKIKYKDAEGIPILAGAENYMIAVVKNIGVNGSNALITSKIVQRKIGDETRLINRAEYLLLDTLVKVTKPKSKFRSESVKNNCRVIKKVAPKSEYDRIADKILKNL